jgi:hypothetical protein
MPLVRFSSSGLTLAFICAALCAGAGCGGDSEDDAGDGAGGGQGQSQMREGPEGCYIEANRMCDCDLGEAACTEAVGIWTAGCESCAM